jgi:DUF1680 family protein
MLQATGKSRYADLLERALHNAFLAGVSLEGRAYFYANPLEVREVHEAPHESEWSGETAWYVSPAPEQATSHRRSWFRCACCPPNVMRVLSSVERYLATTNHRGLQIHQYTSSRITVDLAGGRVVVRVATDYPWGGKIAVEIIETSMTEPWELSLRVPIWAAGATAAVNGSIGSAQPGYWRETRSWAVGDAILLTLPVDPRVTGPMPRASAIYGTVAIERGPLVYCIEQADNPGICLADLRFAPRPELRAVPGPDLVPGLVAVATEARVAEPPAIGAWAYASPPSEEPAAAAPRDAVRVTAIPYFAWANRGGNAMRVWIPVDHSVVAGGASDQERGHGQDRLERRTS